MVAADSRLPDVCWDNDRLGGGIVGRPLHGHQANVYQGSVCEELSNASAMYLPSSR